MPSLPRLRPSFGPRATLIASLLASGFLPSAAAQCNQLLVGETSSCFDEFASSFDVDGGWAVVAAPRDDQAGPDAGAAYVLREQGGAWAVEEILSPQGLPPGSTFTHARVAIDYPWAFAGSLWEPAPGPGDDRGVVRVYRHDAQSDKWKLEQRLWIAGGGPSTGFGGSVETDDGALFVSARGRQELWVFRLDGDTWETLQVLGDPEPEALGDWLGLEIAAEHGDVATASVRPGVGLVAYRFRGLPGAPPQEVFRLEQRTPFESSAVKAGEVALGWRDLAVQGFLTTTLESSTVHVLHEQPGGESTTQQILGPAGSTSEFGRALAFAGDGDEELFVGARAFAGAVGPLGLGHVLRRTGEGLHVESEFRATPSYPQLRFATGARVVDGRLFVATQDSWDAADAISGRLYAFDRLPSPSLVASDLELSVATGGTQELTFRGCPALAGQAYLVIGAFGLLPPGGYLSLGHHSLAVAPDAWTVLGLDSPNHGPFVDTFGLLDAEGRATARIVLPPQADNTLVGVELFHQAVSFDPLSGAVTSTSIPVPLTLGL